VDDEKLHCLFDVAVDLLDVEVFIHLFVFSGQGLHGENGLGNDTAG